MQKYLCLCVCVRCMLDCMFILFHNSLSSSCWDSFCFVVADIVGRTEDRYICWHLITLFEELDLLDKQWLVRLYPLQKHQVHIVLWFWYQTRHPAWIFLQNSQPLYLHPLERLRQNFHQTRLDLWLEKYIIHQYNALSMLYVQKSDFWPKTNTTVSASTISVVIRVTNRHITIVGVVT